MVILSKDVIAQGINLNGYLTFEALLLRDDDAILYSSQRVA